MPQSELTSDITRLIDEGIESLRWCRQHLEERAAVERLRRLQITLSALALALDYEMDGQHPKAMQALDRADWNSHSMSRMASQFFNQNTAGFDDLH